MALKADRYELQVDTSFWLNETASRGVIVSHSTSGSGAALDNQGTATTPKPVVVVASTPSGNIPVGMLLQDMVSVDTTKFHINFYKDEVNKPGKVAIGRKGWWVTDKIEASVSPVAGTIAYLGNSGLLTSTLGAGGTSHTPFCGRFLSSKNESGFAKVEVNLPSLL